MYKKAISVLALLNLLFLVVYLCVLGISTNNNILEDTYKWTIDGEWIADKKSRTMGIASEAASGQRIVSYDVLVQESEIKYDIGAEDYEILLRIVQAEAGGEDEDGKLLVANVVLNRVVSDKFPDNIYDVVFQQSKGVTQFSPVASGKIWSVIISDETIEAVNRALEGEDISQGALYFASRKYADSDKMKWFDTNLKFLFKHGGHEFFS